TYVLFFSDDTAPTHIYTLSLHDALPISRLEQCAFDVLEHLHRLGVRVASPDDVTCFIDGRRPRHGDESPDPNRARVTDDWFPARSEEHTSELQSPYDLVCRLLLEKKKQK